MKHFNGTILRALLAIVLGGVLVAWPAAAVLYIIMVIGVGFLVPGIFAIVGYFMHDKGGDAVARIFPAAGIGSVLLGGWLILMPGFFVSILMYVLGAVLLIAGVEQIVTLFSARKYSKVSLGYYLLPVLIFLAGLFILLYPMDVIEDTLMIFGVVILIYGINELINWFKFRRDKYIQID